MTPLCFVNLIGSKCDMVIKTNVGIIITRSKDPVVLAKTLWPSVVPPIARYPIFNNLVSLITI